MWSFKTGGLTTVVSHDRCHCILTVFLRWHRAWEKNLAIFIHSVDFDTIPVREVSVMASLKTQVSLLYNKWS